MMTAYCVLRTILAIGVWSVLVEGYLVVPERATWDDAQQYCQSLGSHLVTVDSAEKHAEVLSLVNATYPDVQSYWIGLRIIEGELLFANGNSSLATYDSWKSGEPSGDGECVHAWGPFDFNWNDQPCSTMYPFVCEDVGEFEGLVREDEFMLLARNQNATVGLFSLQFVATGLENVVNPYANAYSVIGAVEPADFLIDDTFYELELVYAYNDAPSDVLRWTQESWITESAVVNADISGINDTYQGTPSGFHGLSTSSHQRAYLDGSGGDPDNWWHAVGSALLHTGGIPGHDRKIAYRSELWAHKAQVQETTPTSTTQNTSNVTSPSEDPAATACVNFGHYNTIGEQYRVEDLQPVNSWQQCQALCVNTSQCQVWNWRTANHYAFPNSCSLGSNFTTTVAAPDEITCENQFCEDCSHSGEETCGYSAELCALRDDIVESVTAQLAEILISAISSSQEAVVREVTAATTNSRINELQAQIAALSANQPQDGEPSTCDESTH